MISSVSPAGTPLSIAIVVPTFNRPDKLALCLSHIAMLQGGPYRTVVVDDGGSEPVHPVCEAHGDWVQLIRKPNAGPAAARNTGALMAEGADLLAFIDDDCRPRPDWILRLAKAQGGVRGRLVGGRVDNALPDNVCSSASQALCSYLYEYYQANGSEMAFFTSNNMCCRRDDFLARGGFDEGFAMAGGEDRDFSMRWQDEGGELVYAHDAAVDHAHLLTLTRFWQQHSNYGRGARQLHLSMDKRGDSRPKLEKVAFYAGMLRYPFTTRSRRPFAEAFLVGLSQVAMVSGYFGSLLAERVRGSR